MAKIKSFCDTVVMTEKELSWLWEPFKEYLKAINNEAIITEKNQIVSILKLRKIIKKRIPEPNLDRLCKCKENVKTIIENNFKTYEHLLIVKNDIESSINVSRYVVEMQNHNLSFVIGSGSLFMGFAAIMVSILPFINNSFLSLAPLIAYITAYGAFIAVILLVMKRFASGINGIFLLSYQTKFLYLVLDVIQELLADKKEVTKLTEERKSMYTQKRNHRKSWCFAIHSRQVNSKQRK